MLFLKLTVMPLLFNLSPGVVLYRPSCSDCLTCVTSEASYLPDYRLAYLSTRIIYHQEEYEQVCEIQRELEKIMKEMARISNHAVGVNTQAPLYALEQRKRELELELSKKHEISTGMTNVCVRYR